MSLPATNIPRKSFGKRLRDRVLRFFRIRRGAQLRVYRGFGNGSDVHFYGHALTLAPIPPQKFRKFFLYNSIALLRLFMVRTKRGAEIEVESDGRTFRTKTETDGFFNFKWDEEGRRQPGTYKVSVRWLRGETVRAQAEGEYVIPDMTKYAFISDIDDTFLISHSGNLRKRLFVLLTENARSRRPFDGAVEHYRLLHGVDDGQKSDNAFFYVSSSEWNLYNYISEFIHQHKLPQGVMLLNTIKTFSGLLSTGQSNHGGKFTRIVRIMESFPEQVFVLLGDDSQKDPDIYASVVKHFPGKIFCVYIRRVGTPQKPHVLARGREIEAGGAKFFYFAKSAEAMMHSLSIGLGGANG